MGSVWVAQHLRLQTEVVIKFIVGEYATHPEALARFEREAALAAQAKSQNVVQIYDYGVANNGLPYIAMELLEGEDLKHRIDRLGRIPLDVFCDWFRQAAAGLSKAHAKGIVHRDIKPANLFLCDDDGAVQVKVLDFGVAKSAFASGEFAQTRTGMMIGTAYYMSPEQTMSSRGIDLRTDLWALGVLAYEALTGQRPFDGEAIGQLVVAITSGRFIPPSQRCPDLPPALDQWMQRALAVDPGERFQSAKEMAAGLSVAAFGSESPFPASNPLADTVSRKPAYSAPTSLTFADDAAEQLKVPLTLSGASNTKAPLEQSTAPAAPRWTGAAKVAAMALLAAGAAVAGTLVVTGSGGPPESGSTELADEEQPEPDRAKDPPAGAQQPKTDDLASAQEEAGTTSPHTDPATKVAADGTSGVSADKAPPSKQTTPKASATSKPLATPSSGKDGTSAEKVADSPSTPQPKDANDTGSTTPRQKESTPKTFNNNFFPQTFPKQ